MPSQTPNTVFQLPSQEASASESPKIPKETDGKRRPIIPGEGARAYAKRSRELEDAARLDVARIISPTPIFDQLKQSHRPELFPIPKEITELEQTTKLIEEAREPAVAELRRLMGPSRMVINVRERLAREEGAMAASFLMNVPADQQWKLYPSGGDWFLEKAMLKNTIGSANEPYSVVHFERDPSNPTRMLKSKMEQGQERLAYYVVEMDELRDLVGWAKKYYQNFVTLPEQIHGKKSAKHRLFR